MKGNKTQSKNSFLSNKNLPSMSFMNSTGTSTTTVKQRNSYINKDIICSIAKQGKNSIFNNIDRKLKSSNSVLLVDDKKFINNNKINTNIKEKKEEKEEIRVKTSCKSSNFLRNFPKFSEERRKKGIVKNLKNKTEPRNTDKKRLGYSGDERKKNDSNNDSNLSMIMKYLSIISKSIKEIFDKSKEIDILNENISNITTISNIFNSIDDLFYISSQFKSTFSEEEENKENTQTPSHSLSSKQINLNNESKTRMIIYKQLLDLIKSEFFLYKKYFLETLILTNKKNSIEGSTTSSHSFLVNLQLSPSISDFYMKSPFVENIYFVPQRQNKVSFVDNLKQRNSESAAKTEKENNFSSFIGEIVPSSQFSINLTCDKSDKNEKNLSYESSIGMRCESEKKRDDKKGKNNEESESQSESQSEEEEEEEEDETNEKQIVPYSEELNISLLKSNENIKKKNIPYSTKSNKTMNNIKNKNKKKKSTQTEDDTLSIKTYHPNESAKSKFIEDLKPDSYRNIKDRNKSSCNLSFMKIPIFKSSFQNYNV